MAEEPRVVEPQGIQLDANIVILKLEAQIGSQATEIATLRAVLEMKDEEINTLRKQLDKVNTKENGRAQRKAANNRGS